jgi:hypothetical protein
LNPDQHATKKYIITIVASHADDADGGDACRAPAFEKPAQGCLLSKHDGTAFVRREVSHSAMANLNETEAVVELFHAFDPNEPGGSPGAIDRFQAIAQQQGAKAPALQAGAHGEGGQVVCVLAALCGHDLRVDDVEDAAEGLARVVLIEGADRKEVAPELEVASDERGEPGG